MSLCWTHRNILILILSALHVIHGHLTLVTCGYLNAQALHMCSECLLLLEECPDVTAVQEMNQSIEVGLLLVVPLICLFLISCI